MRKQLVSGRKLLLFVDTGDNCRCPLAIGYLTKLLSQKNIDYIDLRHMGVMTPNDLLPTPEVVQLLKEEGIDIKYHRSRPVDDKLIRAADIVFGFTAIHVQTCLRRVPESKPKTFLLKEYVGLGASGDQIHDPMGSTMEIFKKYFAEIKQALHKLMETEFITTPPEPKEVVIAASVSKPRQTDDEDDIMSERRDESRRAKIKRPVKPEEPSQDKAKEASDADASPDAQVAEKPAKGKKPEKAAPAAGKAVTKKAAGKEGKTTAKKASEDNADKAVVKTASATKATKVKPEKPAKAAPAAKAAKSAEPAKAEKKASKSVVEKSAAAPVKAKATAKKPSATAAAKTTKTKK